MLALWKYRKAPPPLAIRVCSFPCIYSGLGDNWGTYHVYTASGFSHPQKGQTGTHFQFESSNRRKPNKLGTWHSPTESLPPHPNGRTAIRLLRRLPSIWAEFVPLKTWLYFFLKKKTILSGLCKKQKWTWRNNCGELRNPPSHQLN